MARKSFELLRQAESASAKRPQRAEPPVDARLWEDPWRRWRVTANAAPMPRRLAAQRSSPGCRPPPGRQRPRGTLLGETPKGLAIIAAMLPGAALLGAEEARRRARYAVLGGLNAEGYLPGDSELLRLMRVRRCERFADCADREEVGPARRGQPSRGVDGTASRPTARVDQRRAAEVPKSPRLSPIDLVYGAIDVFARGAARAISAEMSPCCGSTARPSAGAG